MRHGTPERPSNYLAAEIERAQLYEHALTPKQVAASGGFRGYVSRKDLLEAMTENQRQRLFEIEAALMKLTNRIADLRLEEDGSSSNQPWYDLAQAVFSFKEFIYLR